MCPLRLNLEGWMAHIHTRLDTKSPSGMEIRNVKTRKKRRRRGRAENLS